MVSIAEFATCGRTDTSPLNCIYELLRNFFKKIPILITSVTCQSIKMIFTRFLKN